MSNLLYDLLAEPRIQKNIGDKNFKAAEFGFLLDAADHD
jgi:hypothetical protein